MKIAVFSDTHGLLQGVQRARSLAGEVDVLIHLGDHATDAPAIAEAFGVPHYAVGGNCDYGLDAPAERVLEFEDVRLFCTHGHRYRDLYRLSLQAEQERCQAALFGHTHIPLLQAHGALLLINPGSLSKPRGDSNAGFAVLTVQGAELRVQMFSL